LGECTAGDVLADPERYAGETLADPLEGIAYGRGVAKIMRRANGMPWIHSFAHGRTIYELQHDATSVRNAMGKAEKDVIVTTLARLAANADLDPVELEELRQLAKKLTGVGLRAIEAALKSAQQQQAEQVTKTRRALRQDPRPPIPLPAPDAEWKPQMKVLNEVVGKVTMAAPPSRDIDHDAMRVSKIPIPDMHAFGQEEVNVEPEETTDD